MRFILCTSLPQADLAPLQEPWPYFVPPMAFLLTYILSVVLCMAVTAMAGWHLFMIASGETSVESQDHELYRRVARDRGEVPFPPSADESVLNVAVDVCELL